MNSATPAEQQRARQLVHQARMILAHDHAITYAQAGTALVEAGQAQKRLAADVAADVVKAARDT